MIAADHLVDKGSSDAEQTPCFRKWLDHGSLTRVFQPCHREQAMLSCKEILFWQGFSTSSGRLENTNLPDFDLEGRDGPRSDEVQNGVLNSEATELVCLFIGEQTAESATKNHMRRHV